jgi:general stress protein YciG
MEIEQGELWELLPGSAGGRTLRRLKGDAYFAELGKRGGEKTRDRYGKEYLREIARRGSEATRKRYHTQPRIVKPWYGGVERRIPYWPPKATKRRRRPLYIRVEVEDTSQDASP